MHADAKVVRVMKQIALNADDLSLPEALDIERFVISTIYFCISLRFLVSKMVKLHGCLRRKYLCLGFNGKYAQSLIGTKLQFSQKNRKYSEAKKLIIQFLFTLNRVNNTSRERKKNQRNLQEF